jgi:hypothetical protein
VTEQPAVTDLLREASERLAETQDKLDAAQLLERERADKLREAFSKVAHEVCALSDLLQELVR